MSRGYDFLQGFIVFTRGFFALLSGASRLISRLLGLPHNGQSNAVIISSEDGKPGTPNPEGDGPTDPPEHERLLPTVDFGDLVVRQVSIPRTEIIAVESTAPAREAIQVAAANSITKLPVYEENLDHIIGILHLKDLLPALLEADMQNRPVRELAREALFVPESISVNHLLVHMRARRQHMAITLDEFGGTAGLVTLEDVLEEIVGDVQDPFDEDPPIIQPLEDGSALIDGMAQIEEVNAYFGLRLDDPNYDTIAGYLLGRLGRMAQAGDVVVDEQDGVRLRVESLDRLRIARIHLSRL